MTYNEIGNKTAMILKIINIFLKKVKCGFVIPNKMQHVNILPERAAN